jgi:hypothetical protein
MKNTPLALVALLLSFLSSAFAVDRIPEDWSGWSAISGHPDLRSRWKVSAKPDSRGRYTHYVEIRNDSTQRVTFTYSIEGKKQGTMDIRPGRAEGDWALLPHNGRAQIDISNVKKGGK